MKPFVGLPLDAATTTCTYSSDLDQPRCSAEAVSHIAVRSPEWGVVGLLTCADHESTARASGRVLGEHPFGDLCPYLTGECWS
jgi:hypothetical protein